MIGLKRGTVELLPYTDKWKKLYSKEEKIILSLIKDYVIDIQHVGSTAIAGLNAKPIIDIIIGLKTFDYLAIIIQKLEANGYIYRPQSGTDERVLFVKGNDDIITHHIHVVKWNSDEWNNHVFFRDYLIKHDEIAKEYSNLKNKLGEKYKDDRYAYTDGKSEFIQNIIMWAKIQFQNS